MKKVIISFLALAALICVLTLLLPFGAPALPGAAGPLAMTESGRVYTAEARWDANWIYGFTGNEVDEVYRLPAAEKGRAATLRQLCADGDAVAALLSWQGTGGTGWRVWLKQADASRFEVLAEGTLAATDALPVISCEKGVVYLAFTRLDGTGATLYTAGEAAGRASLRQVAELSAPAGTRLATATGLGGRLWAVLNDGRLLMGGEGAVFPEDGTAQMTLLRANAGVALVYDASQRAALYSGGLVVSRLPALPGGSTVCDGVAAGEGKAVFLVSSAGKAGLLRLDGAGYGEVGALRFSVGARAKMRIVPMVALLIALLVVYLIVLALRWLLRGSKHFAAKATGVCAIVLALALLVLTPMLAALSWRALEDAGLQQARAAADALAARAVAGQPLAGADGADGALLGSADGVQVVADAAGIPAGAPVAAVYGAGAEDMARVAQNRNAQVSAAVYTGRGAAFYAVGPVRLPDGRPALVLARVDGTAAQGELAAFMGRAWLVCGIAAVVLLVAVLCMSLALGRSVGRLRRAMELLADGQMTLPDAAGGSDEAGGLWHTMREMAGSLAVKDYAYESAIRSYKRFVPDAMEQFLGHATPADAASGDMAMVKGAVAMVSATNRAHVRSALDDTSFMAFVNGCYAAVDKSAKANGGILLGNNFDLASLQLYFGFGGDAMGFALALLDATGGEGAQNAPAYFQMLHQTEFLYGITGSDSRAINFISSSEMDFLADVCAQFGRINCRLVATDRYMRAHEHQASTRYIGFVSSPDGRFTYKLYEVLDVYNSIERSRRQQYAVKFQSTINQFYRGEFHAARNAFSAMLKICPTDGVARWYLYACEYYFNRQDTENFNYGLFGTRLD